MTDEPENIEEKYPHWRTALFGNHNAVANLRCAIEYVLWHTAYLLLSIVGAAIVAVFGVAKIILHVLEVPFRYIGGPFERIGAALGSVGRRLSSGARSFLSNDTVVTVFAGAALVIIGAGFVALVGLAVYLAILNPFEALKGVGTAVGILLVTFILIEGIDRVWPTVSRTAANGARTAAETAVETPGIRRVYGKCPVSFDQSPRWFDSLFSSDSND
jgi:hypothetical protein